MITPHRPNRLSGYQQQIVDNHFENKDSKKNLEQRSIAPLPSISKKEETSFDNTSVPDLVYDTWFYDGNKIQSINSERYETLEMADTKETSTRALGVDIGTGFISCAEHEDGKKKFRKVRDAFFKLNPSKFLEGSANQFGETMLKNSGAHYIKIDDQLYVLGDDAFKFASLFHQECLRPMSQGVLNPREPVSNIMVAELIKAVAGKPKDKSDVLYYCVPAEPIDADFDVEYHKQILHGVFEEVGYKNINVMTEGLAVIYSELADTQYTGIGMSFGAGMCNIVYSFMGIPVFAFSLGRGGDWIDAHAAKHTDETHNVVTSIKEKADFSLYDPTTGMQKAISIYYDALLTYVVQKFKELYEKTPKRQLPNVTMEMPIVIAGGTSLMMGFVERLRELIAEDFPVPVSEVRHAKDPIFAVSNGLYEAAKIAVS
tara:strand:- start:10613 stop:11899 length:1287 start_codon:yes stop_codon:yes gene_type:complete